MHERVIAVVGPTAAGKSELALGLALALGGEVVNADSMQLYAGMDIGTAKLTIEQRRGVPHHLLDIWDVRRTANAADYQRLARDAIADLDCPGTDPHVRERLEAELTGGGPGPLHARLAAIDPDAAAAILPSNGRRIVRALEVIEISGRP